MRKLLPNLLAGLFNVLAGTASVASLPFCVGTWVPGAFASAALLAIVYQCVCGRQHEQDAEATLAKLDVLLRNRARDKQTAVEIAQLVGLPTDGVGTDETAVRLLFESLAAVIRQSAEITEEELSRRIGDLLSRHEGLEARLAAMLLDQTIGLQSLLREESGATRDALRQLGEELAQRQEQAFNQLRQTLFYPRLYLPLVAASNEEASALRRLYFGSRRVTLVGREDELRQLHEFLAPQDGAAHDLRWWLWTGAAGVGKSRLALELCLQAMRLGYQAGFWDSGDAFADWDKWQVDRPTLIVVDYVAERPDQISDGLVRLYQHPGKIRAPLRFLLLERSADPQRDDWFRRFNDAGSTSRRLALDGGRFRETFEFRGLAQSALEEVFDQVFADFGFAADRPKVLALYQQIDPEGRPLLAAAAAEAIVHGGGAHQIRDWTKADLVQNIVDREVDRWRAAGIDEAHLNLLFYATVVRGCAKADCDRLHEQGLAVPRDLQRNDDWLARVAAYSRADHAAEIRPLEPDMLGEWFVLQRLNGNYRIVAPNADIVRSQSHEMLLNIWKNLPREAGEFSFFAAGDYGHLTAFAALIHTDFADCQPGGLRSCSPATQNSFTKATGMLTTIC